MVFGQPFYAPDDLNMTVTRDYVIDDLVLAEWISAGRSPSYSVASPEVEVKIDDHDQSSIVDLAKKMRQSRLEDETRIKELRHEKQKSHDVFTRTNPSATRRETISIDPTYSRRPENVFREYRSAREIHTEKDHQEAKDAFSVGTGDTEQETLDGSWPEDNFSRALHSCTGSRNIRQVASLEQPPRRAEQRNMPRVRSAPPREEEDETCDITSCRMSSGICVDCTKCAKHCTCDEEPSKPLLCDPNTCKQLICGDCSRCTRHCECIWNSRRDKSGPVSVRKRNARKKSPIPVYPQQRISARRSPLPPTGAGKHSPYAPLPPTSPRSARHSSGPPSPARSSSRHSTSMSSMNMQNVPRAERSVQGSRNSGIYGQKRKVIYRNIEQ
jgi:hypothetical protein